MPFAGRGQGASATKRSNARRSATNAFSQPGEKISNYNVETEKEQDLCGNQNFTAQL